MDEKNSTELVPVSETRAELPPILVGRLTPAVEAQVGCFYGSVAQIFGAGSRGDRARTRSAYRQDVMDFVRFLGIRWPDESTRLFTVSVADVLAFRDQMLAESKAPKTINRRIASLLSFYKYFQGVASEFRLPITVPNPAHAQFIPGVRPTRETRSRPSRRRGPGKSWACPSGDSVLDFRDRAILKFFLYSGARIGTHVASGSRTSTRTATRRPSPSTRRPNTREAAMRCNLSAAPWLIDTSVKSSTVVAIQNFPKLSRLRESSWCQALRNQGIRPARLESPSTVFGNVSPMKTKWHLVTVSLVLD